MPPYSYPHYSIYIQNMFHEIPSIGYIDIIEDGKTYGRMKIWTELLSHDLLGMSY